MQDSNEAPRWAIRPDGEREEIIWGSHCGKNVASVLTIKDDPGLNLVLKIRLFL